MIQQLIFEMLTAIVSKYSRAKLYSFVFSYHCCSYSNFHRYGFALPLYVQGIRGFSRNYHCTRHVRCIPIRVSKSCQLGVLRDSVDNWKSFSTKVSPQVAIDDVLNQVLAAMEDPSVSREEVCIHFIQKLCAAGSIMTAAKLMHALRDKNIFLSPHAYNYLLEAAAVKNDIDLLMEIFKDLLFSCGSIGLTSYLILARALSNHNDPALLLAFVSDISEMSLSRDDIVLNRLIFALGKCGQVDKSLLVFQHMKHLKCKPDLVTYNTILAFLGRLGRIDEMLQEFEFMKTVDLIPDIFTYNTMLNSLRKMGRLQLCLVYFKEMSDIGIQPDILTFKDLIESLGRSGNIEGALKIFNEMKCRGIRPSIHVYRAIIFSLKKMGKMELALKFSNEMSQCLPDSVLPRDFQHWNK